MLRTVRTALCLALLVCAPIRWAHAQDASAVLAASTPAELSKVDAINSATAQQMEPVLKGSEGPLMKLRSARDIEQKKEAQLQAVLTPDQYQKFLASKEELKQKLEAHLAQKAGAAK